MALFFSSLTHPSNPRNLLKTKKEPRLALRQPWIFQRVLLWLLIALSSSFYGNRLSSYMRPLSLRLIGHIPVDHRQTDGDVIKLADGTLERIAVEHDDVGALAGFQCAHLVLPPVGFG